MPSDRSQLAAIRKLLGGTTALEVRQGLELAQSLGDPEVLTLLAAGVSVDAKGCVVIAPDAEVQKRVYARFRLDAALRSLRAVGGLKGVTVLDLSGSALEDLGALAGADDLTTLKLSESLNFASLDGLDALPALERLDVSGCGALRSVAGVRAHPRLTHLNLARCGVLTTLEGLDDVPALRVVTASGCGALVSVEGVRNLPSLQELHLDGCKALPNLDGLSGVPALAVVRLHGCTALKRLRGLSATASLRELSLVGCTALEDLSGHAPEVAADLVARLRKVGARVTVAPSEGPEALDFSDAAVLDAFFLRAREQYGEVWAAVHLVTPPPHVPVSEAGVATWHAARAPADAAFLTLLTARRHEIHTVVLVVAPRSARAGGGPTFATTREACLGALRLAEERANHVHFSAVAPRSVDNDDHWRAIPVWALAMCSPAHGYGRVEELERSAPSYTWDMPAL